MKTPNLSARAWLRSNGYAETAALIEQIMEEWKRTGRRTRRNWWDILAGDANGDPRIVEGRRFPVLRAVRSRQGLPDSENSTCHSTKEKAPPAIEQARWSNKQG
jgi:hypothetical protein